ncbi:MAG: aminopeptidase P family protein [Candidatus Krumholzibacteriota bacterium]|nr:aminopeptidase P family protein [Candidatus Krumholzibacteriota bacterium]
MIREKISQAPSIMKEENIDLWLTFARETEVIRDPVLDLILGANCTWQSAFIITSEKDTVAIVGSLDETRIRETEGYEVIGYKQGIGETLIRQLDRFSPGRIAINYSENDLMSDGLTHGMYLILMKYLEGTPYADRLVSSEGIISKLRGRKSPEEIRRIKKNIDLTEMIFSKVSEYMKPGMTEKEVAAFILDQVAKEGVETSWEKEQCPSVFTGPESAGAHAGPTDRKIEKGHVLNIDFGTRSERYCSDLQRTWYFLRDSETKAPEEVIEPFNTIRDSIALAAAKIRPGMEGREVDTIARKYITDKGYDEFPHALGHQVGQATHDGAGLLCPEWERYGNLPYLKIEENQVYTIEPRINIPGYGVATMEEIIVVRPDGGQFLSDPQKEIILI